MKLYSLLPFLYLLFLQVIRAFIRFSKRWAVSIFRIFWNRFVHLCRLNGTLEMGEDNDGIKARLFGTLVIFMRRFLFSILSVGPIPKHMAFIMDGNRRFAKKWKLEEGAGHKAGFLALMSVMRYCHELGVKYASVYAFSIDNFRRRPAEVQHVMDLMQEKIVGLLKEVSIVNQYGVRVHFIGNLKLLPEHVRVAAEKAMLATANNTNTVLFVCVAYSSTDEIAHSAQVSCQEKWDEIQALHASGATNGVMSEQKEEEQAFIKLVDLEKNMYMGLAPDPDIMVRTSGETRLSNFLLWQSSNCILYAPSALWPEFGLWHMVWAILNFQRNYNYLEKRKKQF